MFGGFPLTPLGTLNVFIHIKSKNKVFRRTTNCKGTKVNKMSLKKILSDLNIKLLIYLSLNTFCD